MKRINSPIPLLAWPVLVVCFMPLVLQSCTGVKVRTSVMWPTIEKVWPRIAEDVVRGGGDVTAMNTAVANKNAPGAIAAWTVLKPAALQGVAKLPAAVRPSGEERLRLFSEAVTLLITRNY
ncbi:MAG: hypothetical protein KAR40_06140 [Candidatus Sabulitectum sp.]|nr:hypothetical protein [Candidatus Sabulitectum sp.]